MKLDLQTLSFCLGLAVVSQVIALLVQYRVNRDYRGIGWWLLGSACMALGFIFLPIGTLGHPALVSRIGNPLLVLGRIGLLIGICRFVDRRISPWILGSFFLAFLALYYFFMFGWDSISGRTVVVSAAIAALSVAAAYHLLFKSHRSFSGAAAFTGSIFLLHGGYLVAVTGYTLFSKPIQAYADYSAIQMAAFIIPAVTSTLCTFGFILMVNQRLSSDHIEEKENLRKVFNTSPDAALITRLSDGVILDANLGFSGLSGYERSAIIGTSVRDLDLWCDPSDRVRLMAEVARTGHCENIESVYRRKGGGLLVGMTSARTLTIGDQPHLVSVTRDITGKRLAEEALKESEETYRSILRASPDDITITDLEGRILLVSPAASRMFGYEPGDEVGRSLLDFVAPEDQEWARSNVERLLQGSIKGPNAYRGIRKDGSSIEIEVNSGLIHGIHGQPVKMVFIVRDITERRKAEAEREELASRTRQLQKAESLGRMAGAVAHHFNNQLQSVMGNLELMSDTAMDLAGSRWLTRARQATERAAEVSRNMLAYLGQASRDQEPRFLSELCRASLPIIQGSLPEFVAIEAKLPEPGPVIRVDATQFQQVLTNLVTNAWEATTGTRGSIRIALTTCLAADIPETHRFPVDWLPQAPSYACLEVADTGCGIAAADIEKLFDPFFSTKFSGRGLGLSVVLGIVQAHGGALTVESRKDQGSTFRVFLPVCAGTQPDATAAEPRPAGHEGGGTILLVDDDEYLLMATGAIIERMGYTLLTARDGVEAVDVFRQHRAEIRCVITDLTMPRMDGWETLAALHELDPALPVIMASGYDKAQVMSGAHPHRPHAFLGKPYGLQALRETLDQVLAEKA